MLKVYLAAPYSAKDRINEYAAELRGLGIHVTSSWLNEPHAPSTELHELTPEDHRKYAKQDLADIIAANVFVLFTDPTKTIVRAGRHVEMGFAIALGLPVYVVGTEHENIFHYLSGVHHYATWIDVRHTLEKAMGVKGTVPVVFSADHYA